MKILIVEDGGYHFEILENVVPKCDGKVLLGSIEQTESGSKAAKRFLASTSNHKHPVLSVARSKIKIRFENQFIALRVAEELSLLLYEINDFLSFKDVVIIGYGIIGRALAFLLRKYQCNVKIIEIHENIRGLAKSENFTVIQDVASDLFETVPVIIGATGTPSFTLEDFSQFLNSSADTLLLVSASSKRIEFSTVINYFEGTIEDRERVHTELPIFKRVRNLRILRRKHGVEYKFSCGKRNYRIVLLAEGYPVNFYRYGSESLPAKIVDLVNAEILTLVHYINKNHQTLDNRLYLLGKENLANLNLQEIELFRLWLSKNNISNHIKPEHIWDIFPPHPCEDILS
jgi:S-adenosylhomocysteine hydrolase